MKPLRLGQSMRDLLGKAKEQRMMKVDLKPRGCDKTSCCAHSPEVPQRRCPPVNVAWVTLCCDPSECFDESANSYRLPPTDNTNRETTGSQQAGKARRDTRSRSHTRCRAAGFPATNVHYKQPDGTMYNVPGQRLI